MAGDPISADASKYPTAGPTWVGAALFTGPAGIGACGKAPAAPVTAGPRGDASNVHPNPAASTRAATVWRVPISHPRLVRALYQPRSPRPKKVRSFDTVHARATVALVPSRS